MDEIVQRDGVAAAIIDANSDGNLLIFAVFWFDPDSAAWEPDVSGGASKFGVRVGPISYAYGRAIPGSIRRLRTPEGTIRVHAGPSGWWVAVWEDPDWATAPVPEVLDG
ncbi:MAG: hypothetical protein INR66_26285 [Gordonia polyisoprenivorans]|nr:hypothetical protein [Gordonia polyisoprenivorans]